jgi:hypothetical protein
MKASEKKRRYRHTPNSRPCVLWLKAKLEQGLITGYNLNVCVRECGCEWWWVVVVVSVAAVVVAAVAAAAVAAARDVVLITGVKARVVSLVYLS